jgi:acyl-ACP thioesterase
MTAGSGAADAGALTGLVPEPEAGRAFRHELWPGIADGVDGGRVRLDAIARWLQDVAYLDLLDAGFGEDGVWIVRRSRLRVAGWPRFGEPVALTTFCSGIGRFSAERRTTLRGASADVEAVAVWVWIDTETGRPQRFLPEFAELYAPSANGRPAPVRRRHADPPHDCERRTWAFRAADVDVAGHVNNSHHWAVLEDELAVDGEPSGIDAEIEYREPAMPGDAVVLRAGSARWIAALDGTLYASIRIAAGPGSGL